MGQRSAPLRGHSHGQDSRRGQSQELTFLQRVMCPLNIQREKRNESSLPSNLCTTARLPHKPVRMTAMITGVTHAKSRNAAPGRTSN